MIRCHGYNILLMLLPCSVLKLKARGSQSQSPLAARADKLEIPMGTNQAYVTVDAHHQAGRGADQMYVNVQQAAGAEKDKAMETSYQTAGLEEVIYEHPTV